MGLLTTREKERLQKASEIALAQTGIPGFYTRLDATEAETKITLCVIPGYFPKLPSPADVKPVIQGLRAGLAKRGFHAKGVKPAKMREEGVFYFIVP